MTFATSFSRGLTLSALAMGLMLSGANAQNGTNYHVLTNDGDVQYGGFGSQGAGVAHSDGFGVWTAGENMTGSHRVQFSGDFGYRLSGWRENFCANNAGNLAYKYRSLSFTEFDGMNGNAPKIFLNPACPLPGPSFPLGTGSFIPYGTFGGSSFVLSLLPAGTGPAASSAFLLPNEGLTGVGTGTATVVAVAVNANGTVPAAGCYTQQFGWVGSALALNDHIDGLWHYILNSDLANQQYFVFSNDEMNIWQSHTVATAGALTQVVQFFASTDYALFYSTVEPNTTATLAPRGLNLAGPYYTQTLNVRNALGPFSLAQNPNKGFDVGGGSNALSFSGTAGVPNALNGGLGNQNAVNNPTSIVTLGFATWDNLPYQAPIPHNGTVRVTWVSIDLLGASGGNPDTDPGALVLGGTIRVPVVSAGLLQPTTNLTFGIFQHATSATTPGWPDPAGVTSGAFGIPAIAGASQQIGLPPLPAACAGIALNLTYGTSARLGVAGAPGVKTWDYTKGDTSGTKELFLFN